MEHDHLQAKEDFGVYARTARGGIEILHQLSHKGEIEPLLKTAIEIVLRHEVFKGDVLGEWLEIAFLDTHHGVASGRSYEGVPCYPYSDPCSTERISTGCCVLTTESFAMYSKPIAKPSLSWFSLAQAVFFMAG